MGLFDWMNNVDPQQLPVDQQVPETPVLPQQEQSISDQFGQWKAQKQAVENNPLPVDMQITEVVTPQSAAPPSVADQFAAWKAEKQAASNPDTTPLEKTGTVLHKIGSALAEPAAGALEAISYLDKPRGAIANVANYLVRKNNQNLSDIVTGNTKAMPDNILDAAKQGWNENTSYKEMFPEQFKQQHPVISAIGGLATDVALDPMWLLPPVKIAKMIGQGSKAVGLTDKVISPAAKAFKESELGQKAIALGEDVVGKNRLEDEIFDFNASRAKDQVEGQDIVDAVKSGKKEYGENFNALTDYVQARNKPTVTAQPEKIVDDYVKGNLQQSIKEGTVSREQSANVLRDVGEEVPDYLLQDAQKVAKEAGQEIPETLYRDQVLQSIPDERVRKAVQTVGDKFIELNKRYSDDLLKTGRLSDEQYVKFMDGEHLRRSFEQYENPEKFLEAVRKNGTEEEYRRVYQALTNSNAPGAQGFSAAHRVQMKDFIGRQSLSDDTMKKLGLITDPEYRIMDTINRGSKTLREDEFLKKVSDTWGKTADEAADLSRKLPERRQYVPIPDTKGYGALAGKWVPKDIANQVLKTTGTKPENINKTWQKMVSWWKVEKLANPASIMRNFYSGVPMANVFGGVPAQSMPKYMAKVTSAYAKQGKNAPLIRELRETGILDNEWSRQELQSIIGGNPKGIAKIADKGMQAFGAPDKFWRAVVYAYHKDKGKTSKEAAKIANKALLDYSSAPDWMNTLSKSGAVPFIKFPAMAGAQTAKALYERPAAVTKYTKAQNQVNNEDREKIMPDYMKTKTLLPLWNSTRMVNGKPQPVQNNLDLSYILPFANDVNMGNPVIDALQLMRTGKNGLGMDVIKPGMTPNDKVKAYAKYAWNLLGPAAPLPYNYAGDKLANGLSGGVDEKGRQYDPYSSTAQVFLGAKNVPINESEMATQKIKSIEFQMKATKSLMSQTAKNKSLSQEQKAEQVKEYGKQYKQLQSDLKDVNAAFNREKKRGAQ